MSDSLRAKYLEAKIVLESDGDEAEDAYQAYAAACRREKIEPLPR